MKDKSFELRDENLQGEQTLDKCIAFLNQIGISVSFAPFQQDAFLPGLSIEGGGYYCQPGKSFIPG